MKAHFAAAFIVALASAGPVAQAQDAVQRFYAGRTMDVVIGYPPGGGFDSSARLLIRHMPKHLPGAPIMIPKNMPGAGSLVAANYLYNVAPKDGGEFGIIGGSVPFGPLWSRDGVSFEATRFNWIGSMNQEVGTCAFWGNKARNVADLKAREIVLGGTGPAAGSTLDAKTLQSLLGFNFRMVLGYPGLLEVRLAAHLDQQGMPLSIATTKWFMCLYVNTLPAETLLRVWDVLLVDGPEVLLRVGAALLKLNEPLLLTITDFIALSQELQSLGKGCWSADALLSVAYKQLASPPAARQALATLRRMQLVAHEVGGEAADGVREVRLREGLIPRTLRVGWLRPHRPLPVVPPTKLPPTSGDADAAQGSANATPDLNSPNLDAKEWLKQRAAERAAAAAVSAAPTALPLGPVDDGAGVGVESFTAPGSRMLRPLARRVSVDRPPLTDDALDALNGVPVATHTREGRPLPQTRGGSLDSSRWSTMTIEDEPDDADEDADSPSSVSPIDRGRTRQSAGLDRHRNR